MKYPKATLAVIRDVKTNRTAGAVGLAIRALDAFKPLAEAPGSDVKMLRGLTRRLIKARPTMVCIGNVSAELCCKVEDKAEAGDLRKLVAYEAEKMQRKLVGAKGAIANAFSQHVDRSVVVLTLSSSQTVLEALKKARNQLAQVFVATSEPGGEGVRLSRELSSLGIRNLVVPDLAVGSIMPKVDMVVLGADAVLKDGSVVNKLGSNTLAKIAYLETKQVVFLAETAKVHPSDEEVKLEFEADEKDGTYRPVFDITPYVYVQRIICEDGDLDLARIRSLSDRYQELHDRVISTK